jgi:DNA-binding NtrC family response regulator
MSEILVVDSDGVAGASTSAALRAAGYNVITAASFREARGHIESGRPALLIADVRLGDFNGLHLAWHRHFNHPGMPTIITHAALDPTLKAEAKRLDALYMVKPLHERELLEAVANLLEVSHIPLPMTSSPAAQVAL